MIREYLNKQGTIKIIDAVKNSEDDINLLDGRITALENAEVDTDQAKSVTHAELVNLRNNNLLVPGMFYRITDYNCSINETTSTSEVAGYHSAQHPFDIVLLALSENKLAERGWTTHHEGDTYFADCNLAAWQVWYCLDNDTNRFTWADNVNGKGVIYRLIDEWDNDCCYDFKNIVFEFEQGSQGESLYNAGNSSAADFGYVYTFNYFHLGGTTGNKNIDASVYQSSNASSGFCVCHNVISSPNHNKAYSNSGQILPRIGFFLDANANARTLCEGNKIDTFCEGGDEGAHLTFIAGRDVCHNIIMSGHKKVIMKNDCHNNIIYTADTNPVSLFDAGDIVLNASCDYNVVGGECGWITLGSECSHCKIDGCKHVTLGSSCEHCKIDGGEYVTLQAGVALNGEHIRNVRVDNVKGTSTNPITINHMTVKDDFITTYTSARNQTIVI